MRAHVLWIEKISYHKNIITLLPYTYSFMGNIMIIKIFPLFKIKLPFQQCCFHRFCIEMDELMKRKCFKHICMSFLKNVWISFHFQISIDKMFHVNESRTCYQFIVYIGFLRIEQK